MVLTVSFGWENQLLIVLNGIEILLILLLLRLVMLLIVLNGIEIRSGKGSRKAGELLIVLNGIEIDEGYGGNRPRYTFNRTKWN